MMLVLPIWLPMSHTHVYLAVSSHKIFSVVLHMSIPFLQPGKNTKILLKANAVGIPSDRPGNIQDISLYENYLKVKIVLSTLKSERDHSLHECGEMKCRVCHEYYLDEDNHLCYLRAFSSDLEPDKFIFYDFECTQEEGKHEPNFVVAHSIGNTCEKEPVTAQSTCKNCGSHYVTNSTRKKMNGKEIHVLVVEKGK